MSYDKCGPTNTITLDYFNNLTGDQRAAIRRWITPIAERGGVAFDDCYRVTYDKCRFTFYFFMRDDTGRFYKGEDGEVATDVTEILR